MLDLSVMHDNEGAIRLYKKLGFEKDETVIAWLLEQIELSPDLDKAIGRLLEG